ncbi:MAG TPA: helix-turn-helix domain-containing protein [Opitutaceae bacterium]|nr:helix-turn-helix domain-containing protein [Opitutaceae bacterium]
MPDVRFETFGLAARLLSPPRAMERIHHHSEIEINYLLKGEVTYLHRGVMRRLIPRRLTMFWGSTPHTLVAADRSSRMAWITVPLAWVWSWTLPARFVSGLMEGNWWVAPADNAGRFAVLDWVKELANANHQQQRRLLYELQACLLWMAEKADVEENPKRNARVKSVPNNLRHVEAMARCMAERYHEKLSIADVAGSAGLHPNYAMPLFQRLSGITIGDYLRQCRVTNAQRLLLLNDDKVVDVALACGFGSLSAFYEVFGRCVGESPQAFRRRMRE